MPLDPRIILQAGQGVTPPRDPLDTLGAVYGLQNAQQVQQINQLQLDAAQRAEFERQNLGQAIRGTMVTDPQTGQMTPNMVGALGRAYQTSRDPLGLLKVETEYGKSQAEMRRSALEARKLETEQHVKNLEYGGQVAAGMEAQIAAGADPQQVWQWGIASMRQAGFPIQGVPPTYDASYLARWKAQALSQKDRLQAEQNALDRQLEERRVQLLETDPQRDYYKQRARREEKEVEALQDLEDLERDGAPGTRAPGEAPRQGGRVSALTPAQEPVAAKIRAEARRQGVDPELAVAVARQESGLDQRRVGDNGRSVGLFQLQPAAAQEMGLRPEERTNEEANIRAGVGYLKRQLDAEDGNVERGLSRYNRGTPTYQGSGDPNYERNVLRYYPTRTGSPAPTAAAPAPAAPRLAADEERLRRLEAQRDRQEQHLERIRPVASRSEVGRQRLQQGEQQLQRMNQQINTLRDRIYEQGPESLARKEAVARAGVEASLDKPLSSEDAALYGVPAGTTARELREQVVQTPLKGEAAKTYQMGARMNRAQDVVATLEAQGVTGTPFLNTLEQTVDKLTGAVGTVVGVASGGGFAGAGAGGAAGLGVGNLASPLVNQLRTPEQRRYVMGQLAFIAGILRKESGAAISAEEYKQYSRIYFPQSGDDAETIAAKRAMRQAEIDSLQEQFPNRPFPGAPEAATRGGAAPAGPQVPPWARPAPRGELYP